MRLRRRCKVFEMVVGENISLFFMLLCSRNDLGGDGQSVSHAAVVFLPLLQEIFIRDFGTVGWFWFVRFLVLGEFT